MKRNFFLIALTALLPLYAFGDFIPGRVRTSADAELERLSGNGRFESVQRALVTQLKTDGRGITHFRLALDAAPPISFQVRGNQHNRCGQTYFAALSGAELRIDESSPSSCGSEGATTWRATLTTSEGSSLVLTGTPKFYLLTQ
jgi:hypothetical protein